MGTEPPPPHPLVELGGVGASWTHQDTCVSPPPKTWCREVHGESWSMMGSMVQLSPSVPAVASLRKVTH